MEILSNLADFINIIDYLVDTQLAFYRMFLLRWSFRQRPSCWKIRWYCLMNGMSVHMFVLSVQLFGWIIWSTFNNKCSRTDELYLRCILLGWPFETILAMTANTFLFSPHRSEVTVIVYCPTCHLCVMGLTLLLFGFNLVSFLQSLFTGLSHPGAKS